MEQEKVDTIGVPYNGQSTVLSSYIKPQHRKPHDPDVTFEEYHYYARKTREEEQTFELPNVNWREIMLRKKTKPASNGRSRIRISMRRKPTSAQITDEEWTNASRAFRTASWGACE
jgi:hypothetical protein